MISGANECGGSEQALSPEWMPASSMCSMMPATKVSLPSRQAIDVDLDGVGQIAVDQQRALVGDDEFGRAVERRRKPRDVAVDLGAVVDDFHAAAAEHVGRADDDRIADLVGDGAGFARRLGDAAVRAACSFSFSISALKRSRSSARSMASGEVPRIGTPASSSALASFSGVWPPNCTMTPLSVPFAALDAR